MAASIAEFEDRIAGIPCVIAVTYWEPYAGPRVSGPPERCSPAEGGQGKWEVRDRSGRAAPWLEQKLTPLERERIDRAVFNYMERGDE